MNKKWVIVIQAMIILLLIIFLVREQLEDNKVSNKQGLLSPRIYSGILEPKSYLIINFVPLKKELESYINDRNLTVSIYLVNLRDGASMSIDSYRAYAPASLSKVPVAILMMKKVEEGKIALDTPLEIREEDREENSGNLYQTKEKTLPLNTLFEDMLTKSDNTAFKIMLRYLEKDDEEILSNYWDFFSLDNRPQQGQKGETNLVTARSIYNIFLSLYLSTVLEPQHSEYILSLLTDTLFDIKKIAQLPDDVRVAHKYGVREDDKVKVFHDCGILYIEEMRMFYCVMTSDLSQEKAAQHIGYSVNKIYHYVNGTRTNLNKFKEKELEN